ncbi:MAG: hypothetical protein HPY89_03415 [Pelotomaculum sp.]|uniref:Uncharacterized protein n=1 Tax=Pelotomaculum thermopropionicum (strain DSM 13744 / JCM 10971 / SI) TaxID=370438 RepID=A5D3V1_PELTS|nr:hypothetical protein [Pelotomaculum sp.]BAF59093.1 hypothetical protein PTH_0912 [Pelotomaculum thermopropionicum SI]
MTEILDFADDVIITLLKLYEAVQESVHETCRGYCGGCPPYRKIPREFMNIAANLEKEGYIEKLKVYNQDCYIFTSEGERRLKLFNSTFVKPIITEMSNHADRQAAIEAVGEKYRMLSPVLLSYFWDKANGKD